MNINDILTENEYKKERPAKELFEFVKQKGKELSEWNPEHSDAKTRRKMRYKEHGKGLPYKLEHELKPFAYYANAYYGNKPEVRFKPCCGSEQYDGIIVDNNNVAFALHFHVHIQISPGDSPLPRHGPLGRSRQTSKPSLRGSITSSQVSVPRSTVAVAPNSTNG